MKNKTGIISGFIFGAMACVLLINILHIMHPEDDLAYYYMFTWLIIICFCRLSNSELFWKEEILKGILKNEYSGLIRNEQRIIQTRGSIMIEHRVIERMLPVNYTA